MKLWLLKRTTEDPGWDEYLGFVVRALDDEEARRIASEYTNGDEGKQTWMDPSQVRCEYLGEGPGDGGVVLDSFMAG